LIHVDAEHATAELSAAPNRMQHVLAARGTGTDQNRCDFRGFDLLIDEPLEGGPIRRRPARELGTPEPARGERRISDPPIPDDARAPQILGKIKAEEDPLWHPVLRGKESGCP
jgi:hypothetical protein